MSLHEVHSDRNTLATFRTIDRIHYHRTPLWYVGFTIFMVVVGTLVWHFAPTDLIRYLGLTAIAIFAVTVLWLDRDPRTIEIRICENGIYRGNKFHHWNEIRHHWFIDSIEHGVRAWYIAIEDDFHRHGHYVRIELIDVHPDEIREIVTPIMTETVGLPEPRHESWRRIFKL